MLRLSANTGFWRTLPEDRKPADILSYFDTAQDFSHHAGDWGDGLLRAEATIAVPADTAPGSAFQATSVMAYQPVASHLLGCGCGACGVPALIVTNNQPASAATLPKGPSATAGMIEATVSLTDTPVGGLVSYGDTFKLHSQASSPYKIFLDFGGHTTTGTAWNSF
ncbi:hypothetical protein E2C05_12285, partial [Paracraurococcus ruber]